MSAAKMAAFITSERGRMFGRVCTRYGQSPGARIFPDDDVAALDVDLAYMVREIRETPASDGPGVITDLERRMRAMSDG